MANKELTPEQKLAAIEAEKAAFLKEKAEFEAERKKLQQAVATNAAEAEKARQEAKQAADAQALIKAENDRLLAEAEEVKAVAGKLDEKVMNEFARLQAENEKLREGMDAKKFVPAAIPGTFNVEWKTPAGTPVKKEMKFKDGQIAVRLKDGSRVSTIGLMQLAKTGKCDEQYAKQGPAIKTLTKETAQAYLTHLTQIKYGYLEEV